MASMHRHGFSCYWKPLSALLVMACSGGEPTRAVPRLWDCDEDGSLDSSVSCPEGSRLCERMRSMDCCAAYCTTPLHLEPACRSVLGLDDSPPGCASIGVVDCDGDGVTNVQDCAACDSTAFVTVADLRTDHDNDGYAVAETMWGPILSVGCGGSLPPRGYTWRDAPTDCDDFSAERYRLVAVDADQDGWQRSVCVGADDPPGVTAGGSKGADCDDSDPAKQLAVYPDADGDGSYSSRSTPDTCVAVGDTLPPNVVLEPGRDCDDGNPVVRPLQADVRFDGVDSNCTNGGDESTQCVSADGFSVDACHCWSTVPCAWSLTCLDGPDIVAIASEARAHCGGTTGDYARVLMANYGAVRFAGTVTISHVDCSGEPDITWNNTSLALAMQPGETRIVEVDPNCRTVHIEVASDIDCRSDNNTIGVEVDLLACE